MVLRYAFASIARWTEFPVGSPPVNVFIVFFSLIICRGCMKKFSVGWSVGWLVDRPGQHSSIGVGVRLEIVTRAVASCNKVKFVSFSFTPAHSATALINCYICLFRWFFQWPFFFFASIFSFSCVSYGLLIRFVSFLYSTEFIASECVPNYARNAQQINRLWVICRGVGWKDRYWDMGDSRITIFFLFNFCILCSLN